MNDHLTKDQEFISKLTEIVHANLNNVNFGVKELAHKSGLSQYKLSRKLGSIANNTITQFISETRLKKALEMLQNEDVTASEVAYKLGFSSPAYFTKCFHDFFGYPPGKVNKANYNIIKEIIPVELMKEKEQKRLSQRIIFYSSAGLLFLILLGYFIYKVISTNFFSINKDEPAITVEKSIAVLPFKNLSDSSANQYFIEGLMDEILFNLTRIHDLRVVSRTSVEQYRESIKSTAEIAKKLNVAYLVEGSGQKYGNTYRLRVQLIQAANDKHIWAKSYEQEIRATKDIFNIQSQIAQAIAEELKVTITPEEKQLIETISTANITAYDFYQRGSEEFRKYLSEDGNNQELRRAEEMYYKALEYDSTFARAYFGLARVYASRHFHDTYFSENFLDSILILADRALSFDDHLAEAYYARAYYYIHHGKKEQAIKEYDKALEYNPNYWEAYWNKGLNLYIIDDNNIDFVKGLENLHKAISINRGEELPGLLRYLGDVYGTFAGFHEKANYYYQEAFKLDGDTTSYFNCLAAGENASENYNKAIELYNNCSARDSDNVEITSGLASTYYSLGQYASALKYVKKFEKSLDMYPWLFYGSMRQIGYVYWENGYKNEADQWFKKQMKMSEESIKMGRFYSVAALYAFTGEKQLAYKNLRIVDKIHACPLWMATQIKTDPFFNNIRNEPEFQQIARDVESKYQAEHERVKKWLEEQGK
jgi:TolB-like protein/AraC-like DNA-binding protein/Tfp pilus assembly protein PilF